jgi:acetyl-CoA acyltransferase 2
MEKPWKRCECTFLGSHDAKKDFLPSRDIKRYLVGDIHSNKMSGIFLVAAKRTPFGAFGGALKAFSATDLGVLSTQAALKSVNLDPKLVDSVFFGNVIQSSPDAAYLARHVGLKCGVNQSTPSLTINRLCGSGFDTVILGAQSIRLGESHISICGGAENMSDAPLVARGNDARWGVKLSAGLSMRDALWDGLTDSYGNIPMGITAENLAKQYNISKEVSFQKCSPAHSSSA